MVLFPGAGTLINALAVVLGAGLGMAIGNRLPERTRNVVTDCLGLVTGLMAALSAASVTDAAFSSAVGSSAPVLIVLGSLLIGGIVGSILRLEHRLEGLAGVVQGWVERRTPRSSPPVETDQCVPAEEPAGTASAISSRERFIEGWLTATLLYCVGPLTILGTLNDGLGRGIDQLAVKSVLDGFASIAFAASFGVGVMCSAVSVLVVQGALTVLGVVLGSVMPEAQISALTATGGLLLVGISLRLLRIKDVPVGDLLPALLVAPLLTALVAALR